MAETADAVAEGCCRPAGRRRCGTPGRHRARPRLGNRLARLAAEEQALDGRGRPGDEQRCRHRAGQRGRGVRGLCWRRPSATICWPSCRRRAASHWRESASPRRPMRRCPRAACRWPCTWRHPTLLRRRLAQIGIVADDAAEAMQTRLTPASGWSPRTARCGAGTGSCGGATAATRRRRTRASGGGWPTGGSSRLAAGECRAAGAVARDGQPAVDGASRSVSGGGARGRDGGGERRLVRWPSSIWRHDRRGVQAGAGGGRDRRPAARACAQVCPARCRAGGIAPVDGAARGAVGRCGAGGRARSRPLDD